MSNETSECVSRGVKTRAIVIELKSHLLLALFQITDKKLVPKQKKWKTKAIIMNVDTNIGRITATSMVSKFKKRTEIQKFTWNGLKWFLCVCVSTFTVAFIAMESYWAVTHLRHKIKYNAIDLIKLLKMELVMAAYATNACVRSISTFFLSFWLLVVIL